VRNGIGIYRADCGLIGDNSILGNGGNGVSMSGGTLFQGKGDWSFTPGPDIITQNKLSGIYGWNGSRLDIREVTAYGNTQNGIALSLQSTLRIYNSDISSNLWNGIALYDGSSVARYSSDSPRDSITNNVRWGIICESDSKLVGVSSNVTGNGGGQVNCPPVVVP